MITLVVLGAIALIQAAPAGATSPHRGAVVAVAKTGGPLGSVLVDGRGYTL